MQRASSSPVRYDVAFLFEGPRGFVAAAPSDNGCDGNFVQAQKGKPGICCNTCCRIAIISVLGFKNSFHADKLDMHAEFMRQSHSCMCINEKFIKVVVSLASSIILSGIVHRACRSAL